MDILPEKKNVEVNFPTTAKNIRTRGGPTFLTCKQMFPTRMPAVLKDGIRTLKENV